MMTIREQYFRKANSLIERLNDDEEEETDLKDQEKKEEKEEKEEKDIETDYTEIAKDMIATYIDKCMEDGIKELKDEYELDDKEKVQEEIERIAKQLKNYLKKGIQ